MAETIGQAYIEIIPTTEGISGKIEGELSGAGSKSGGVLGTALGTAMGNAGVMAAKAAVEGTMSQVSSAINAGIDFDTAMSQVAATKGFGLDDLNNSASEASQQLNALRDTALEYGRTTAFTSTQAAEALNYMALAGWDTQTSIEQLPNVLNLAAAGAMDLADASDMVTDVGSALGLSIEDTVQMVDQMAKVSSLTNTDVEQLGRGMLKIGATAANLKGGTAELSTALGMLANNGIKAAEGGTHLRNMLLSLESGKGIETLRRLGFDASLAYDEFGNLRGIDEIFTDLANATAGMSNAGVDEVLGQMFNKTDLSSARSMLASMSVTFDDLGGKIQAIEGIDWSKLINPDDPELLTALGVMDTAGSMVGLAISRGLSDADIAQSLADELGMTMEEADAVVAAGRSAVVDYTGAWDSTFQALQDCTGAAEEMRNVQEDNLAGDIHEWESALEGARIAISDELTPSLREFVQFGADGLNELTSAFKEGGLDGLAESLGNLLAEAGQKVIEALPAIMGAAQTLLGTIGQAIIDNLPMLMDTGVQIILQLVNGIAEALPELIPAMVEAVMLITETLIENIDLLVDAAIALMGGLAQGLINALPILLEKMPMIVMSLVEALIQNSPQLLVASLEMILSLAQGITDNLPQILESAAEIIAALAIGIIESLPQMALALLNIYAQFDEFFTGLIDTALGWGADMIQGFIDGIKSMIGKVGDAAKAIADKIASFIHFSEPDIGPLSDFHTYAPDMMELFAKGIKDNENVVTAQIEKSFDFGDDIQQTALSDVAASAPAYTMTADELAPVSAETESGGLSEQFAQAVSLLGQLVDKDPVQIGANAAGIFDLVRNQNARYAMANGRGAFA